MFSKPRALLAVFSASLLACGSTSSSSTGATSAASGASSGVSAGASTATSSGPTTGTTSGHASATGTTAAAASSTGATTGQTSTSATTGATTAAASTASGSTSGTTGGSTSGATTGSTTGGSTGALPGHESWGWVYTDYATSLSTIAANVSSFTHISPALYTVNYAYASGVASYANCDGTDMNGNMDCTDNGTNSFDGLTTAQIATQINGLGLKTVPLIYGGVGNVGVDIGVQNILNNTNGAQTSFISSMVTEAVSNDYAGYNLDWEVGSGVDATYASSFVSFVNAFKTAMAPYGMILTADAIDSNINGTYCSGDDGYLDFGQLSTSSIDRVIMEAYYPAYGTAYTSCQNSANGGFILSSTNPVGCPLDSTMTYATFTGLMNFMCANLPASMVVIGVQTDSTNTNPFGGQAVSTMQSYGIDKIAVWPQQEGTYPYLSSQGLVAPQSTWYAVLAAFLQSN